MTDRRTEAAARASAWLNYIDRFDARVLMEVETHNFLAESENRFVLYAADTDIVMCYTSPWNLGIGGSARRTDGFASETPYGVIFPPDQDSEEAANGLTYSIAKYIFFDLNTEWPLFQLPSHSLETERVYGAAAYNAARLNERIKTRLDQFEAFKTELDRDLAKAADATLQALSGADEPEAGANGERSTDRIFEILDALKPLLVNRGRSPSAEIVRYLSLLLEGTLISTDNAPSLRDDDDAEHAGMLDALAQGSDMREWIRESEDRDWWTEKLIEVHSSTKARKTKLGGQTAVRISADAAALARLVTINEKLEPLGGRLLLITGAHAIHQVARQRDNQFYNKYIRHFHSFAPGAFLELENANGDDGVQSEEEFKNEIGYSAIQQFNRTKLRKLLRDSPSSFVQIEREWVDFRDKVIHASVALSDEGIDEVVNLVADAKSEFRQSAGGGHFRDTLDKFATKMRRKILEDRLSLAAEFAATGVEFLLSLGLASSRNPPDVQFDSYKNANDLFRTLRSAKNLSGLHPPFREQLEFLKLDCLSKDVGVTDLGYLHFLIFSGLFAAANRWNIAADLAGHAIEIASLNPETKSDSNVSGREAYYLRASAMRLGARELSDFDDAMNNLQLAQEALKIDKEDRPGLRISPLRFDAEKVATDLGKLHFRRYKSETVEVGYEFVERASDIFVAVRQSETDDAALVVQCAVNGIQSASLFLLSGGRLSDHSCLIGLVSEFRGALRSALSENVKNGVRKTLLMEGYEMFADIIVNPRDVKAGTVKTLFSRILASKLTTVYDKHRFTSLRDQCGTMLGA